MNKEGRKGPKEQKYTCHTPGYNRQCCCGLKHIINTSTIDVWRCLLLRLAFQLSTAHSRPIPCNNKELYKKLGKTSGNVKRVFHIIYQNQLTSEWSSRCTTSSRTFPITKGGKTVQITVTRKPQKQSWVKAVSRVTERQKWNMVVLT